MTAVTWLLKELEKVNYHPTEAMIMYAKKLERQQHSKTWDEALRVFEERGHNFVRAWEDFDKWYETYESKGSDEPNGKKVLLALKEFRDSLTDEEKENIFKGNDDTLKEYHIVDTNEMVDQVPDVRKMVEWIDKEILLNPHYADSPRLREGANMVKVKLQQYTFTSSQTEISDEEIENQIKKRYETTQNDAGFRDGVYWCLEQLKSK